MASPTSVSPPSQIPVSINKRASIPLQSSTSPRVGSVYASSTPPIEANHAAALAPRPASNGRRSSLLPTLRSRQSSLSDSDDPEQLKAQIAMLQHSLRISEQAVADLTMERRNSGGQSWQPVRRSPGSDVSMVQSFGNQEDGSSFTSRSDVGGTIAEEDGSATEKGEGVKRATLPHSDPSFDLRSRALTPAKSVMSPNDGRSRIPLAVVSHAIVINNSPDHRPASRDPPAMFPKTPSPTGNRLRSPFPSDSPNSPLQSEVLSRFDDGRLSPGFRKSSSGSAASTRVIDGLQTELANVRTHLEKVKMEYKSCQRLVGSLTRQTEDLKDTRERMRVQCEGLNNVIARKERQLQEMLERARTAEAGLHEQLSTRKALEQSTRKSLQQMKADLSEAQANQHKADSECVSLRDSVRSLRDVWSREVKGLRTEWKRDQERARQERDECLAKQKALIDVVKAQATERATVQLLADTSAMQALATKSAFKDEVTELKARVDRAVKESEDSKNLAEDMAAELARLRRMMREPRRASLDEATSLLVVAEQAHVDR